MGFSTRQTEILIREVEKRDVIWYTAGQHYYDKFRKHIAWSEVCSILFQHFTSMGEVQKQAIVHEVMGRWRTIRDNYVRKRRQIIESEGSTSRKLKKYIFDEQLSFLQRNFERRLSASSSNQEQNSQYYSKTEELKEEIIEQSIPDEDVFVFQSPKREAESPITSHSMIFTAEQHIPKIGAFDEDMAFFASLLPSVQKLNTFEKFEFRIETMRLLQNQLKRNANAN